MWTPTLDNAAAHMETLLVDFVTISDPGEAVLEEYEERRQLVPVAKNVAALVQKVPNLYSSSNGGITARNYTIKTSRNTPLSAGQYVTVTRCARDASLEGRTFLVEDVSANGWSIIKRATASDFTTIGGEVKMEASL